MELGRRTCAEPRARRAPLTPVTWLRVRFRCKGHRYAKAIYRQRGSADSVRSSTRSTPHPAQRKRRHRDGPGRSTLDDLAFREQPQSPRNPAYPRQAPSVARGQPSMVLRNFRKIDIGAGHSKYPGAATLPSERQYARTRTATNCPSLLTRRDRAEYIRKRLLPTLEQLNDLLRALDLPLSSKLVVATVGATSVRWSPDDRHPLRAPGPRLRRLDPGSARRQVDSSGVYLASQGEQED